MNKLPDALLALFFLFSVLSCKSEEELIQKESLNISFAVTELQSSSRDEVLINATPNPFLSNVQIHISTSSPSNVSVTISDDKGRFKKFVDEKLSMKTIIAEFNNEEAGWYLCEVLVDNRLEKINLIKIKH